MAQNDTVQEKNIRFLGFPVLYRTPETGFAFGAGAYAAFKTNINDSVLRPSQVALGAVYTQEKQFVSYLSYDLWLKSNFFYLKGEIAYNQFNYNFWGVGDEPRKIENFGVDFFRLRLENYYEIGSNWWLGLKFTLDDYDVVLRAEEGRLITDKYTGSDGGFIFGSGLTTKYDTRDNIFFPTSGWNIQLSHELFTESLGSDFNYNLNWLNVAKYIKINKKAVLALNVYNRTAIGEVPFFHMSLVGGSHRMRGYYEGYHRDNSMMGWQFEYRQMLIRRFGAVVFIGNAMTSPTMFDYNLDRLHTTAGVGLRYCIDEAKKINIRLDYGFSKETSGFYFTIAEAF